MGRGGEDGKGSREVREKRLVLCEGGAGKLCMLVIRHMTRLIGVSPVLCASAG